MGVFKCKDLYKHKIVVTVKQQVVLGLFELVWGKLLVDK